MYSINIDGVKINLIPRLNNFRVEYYSENGQAGLRAKRDCYAYNPPCDYVQYPRHGTKVSKGEIISITEFLRGYKESDFELVQN